MLVLVPAVHAFSSRASAPLSTAPIPFASSSLDSPRAIPGSAFASCPHPFVYQYHTTPYHLIPMIGFVRATPFTRSLPHPLPWHRVLLALPSAAAVAYVDQPFPPFHLWHDNLSSEYGVLSSFAPTPYSGPLVASAAPLISVDNKPEPHRICKPHSISTTPCELY